MPSEVSICNLALTKIGEESITSLGDDDKAGRLCNLHYALTRDMVLRTHNWNFATKRVELAALVAAPEFRYAYQFALPTDCLKVVTTNLVPYAEWRLEDGNLLCDDDSVKIEYIARITDPNSFDALFVEVLASRLAAEFAVPLADSITLSDQMFKLYTGKLREARSVDASEGTADGLDADAWLDARQVYNG